MAFSDEVVKDGRGYAILADFSIDNFATILYRWSTHTNVDPANKYEPRITKLGTFTRGFGADNFLTASNVQMELDNVDGTLDWMYAAATAIRVLQGQLKLYVYLYDPNNPDPSQATSVKKQIGLFFMVDLPNRDNEKITLTIADHMLNFVEQATIAPKISDFYKTIPLAKNPLTNAFGGVTAWNTEAEMRQNGTWDQPIPISFGNEPILAILPTEKATFGANGTWDATAANNVNIIPAFYCATRSAAALTATELNKDQLWIEVKPGLPIQSGWYQVPQISTATAAGPTKLWDVYSAGSVGGNDIITVDSKHWTVKWVAIYLENVARFVSGTLGGIGSSASQATFLSQFIGDAASNYKVPMVNLFIKSVKAFPTGQSTSASVITNSNAAPAGPHPADIIQDIVSSYSQGTSANLDTTSLTRLKNARPGLQAIATPVASTDKTPKSLRQVLSDIAATFEIDVFTNFNGLIAVSTFWRDNQALTSAPLSILETRIDNVKDGYAVRDTRHAPYNRLFTSGAGDRVTGLLPGLPGGGKPVTQPINPGPWDDPGGSVATWSRVIARTVSVVALPADQRAKNPWNTLSRHAEMRPVIEFDTDITGLLFELGDYMVINWTRGGNNTAVYVATAFQVEEQLINLGDMTKPVHIKAVYAGDIGPGGTAGVGSSGGVGIFTVPAYTLDDMTLINRASVGSGGRTATVTDNSTTVTFSSGSLVVDGVVAGDILILTDTTEATNTYRRNRHLKIQSVTDATHLVITDADLNFGAPTGVAVSNWQIRQSHLTYWTKTNNPGSYPSSYFVPDGSDQYGCVVDSTGKFSAVGARNFINGEWLS